MVAKSKDSLKACFENVNILLCYTSHVSVPWQVLYLTLCLLVSSADNLCKQLRTRSGLT